MKLFIANEVITVSDGTPYSALERLHDELETALRRVADELEARDAAGEGCDG